MAHHAEDISKIEDIGERLDALLDALETSSEEVARAGSSLDDPDAPAPRASAAPAPVETEPRAEPAPEPEPEPDVAAETPVAGEAIPSETAADTDEALDLSRIEDGLLIEPEAPPPPPSDDIDGAPMGPVDLESELDDELAALLASGVFEDPVGELGVDESAEKVELPEPDREAEFLAETAPARTPKPPTDEAELIGELDEQLAALADAQLASDADQADEPEPGPIQAETAADHDKSPAAQDAPAEAPADRAPASEPSPEVVNPKPVTPKPSKPGWRAAAERVLVVCQPVVVMVAQRTGTATVSAARRVSAPLNGKPQLKQIVGWVALVQAFLAACVWVYLAVWHDPPQAVPSTPQPTLERPAGG